MLSNPLWIHGRGWNRVPDTAWFMMIAILGMKILIGAGIGATILSAISQIGTAKRVGTHRATRRGMIP